jgi:hypothetical protein
VLERLVTFINGIGALKPASFDSPLIILREQSRRRKCLIGWKLVLRGVFLTAQSAAVASVIFSRESKSSKKKAMVIRKGANVVILNIDCYPLKVKSSYGTLPSVKAFQSLRDKAKELGDVSCSLQEEWFEILVTRIGEY